MKLFVLKNSILELGAITLPTLLSYAKDIFQLGK